MTRTRLAGSVVGVLVLVLGVLLLWRSSTPESTGSSGSSAQGITISGAYVRAPLPPTRNAAAYFTLTNNTDQPDRLLSVDSGAGASTVLHVTSSDGSMAAMSDGVVLPAHGSITLSPGKGHVMIENVYGTLKAGDNVNIQLTLERAGSLEVDAKVIAPTAPVPGD
ncbi:MAG: copper chaperone PCu(A)C [Jatrophihabitans sp.]|uniref:copper chaperone PCu(A)C n=1 Tax=Jatrophihabitans sp. TaxID=1932789 RepID=UPI003F7D6C2F